MPTNFNEMTNKTLEQIAKFKERSAAVISDALKVGIICAMVGAWSGLTYHFATQEFIPSRTSPEYKEYVKSYNNLNDEWKNVNGRNLNSYSYGINPRNITFNTGIVENTTNIYKITRMGNRYISTKVDNLDASGHYNVQVVTKEIVARGFEDLFTFRPDLKTPALENAFIDINNKYFYSEKAEDKLLINRMINGSLLGAAAGVIGVAGLAIKRRKEENYNSLMDD